MKVFKIKLDLKTAPTTSAAGFTLIELIVTVGIASILLATAVPSMQSLIRSSRVEGESERIVGLLVRARNSALTSGRPSFVCRSIEATGDNDDIGDEDIKCVTGALGQLDWANDMIAYTQLPNSVTAAPDNRFDNQRIDILNADTAARRQMTDTISVAPTANVIITANSNDFVIRFNPDGTMANNAPFRLAICEPGNIDLFGRIIEIGAFGQIRSDRINTEINNNPRGCAPA